MKVKRLTIASLSILAVIVLLWTPFPFLQKSEPDLLRIGQVIASFDNDDIAAFSMDFGGMYRGYMWIDDNRLVRSHNGSFRVEDLKNGTFSPLPANSIVSNGDLISVSRDGQSLLWSDNKDKTQGVPVVTSFDGRAREKWHPPGNAVGNVVGMTWMPDSKRWIVVSSSTGVYGGSLYTAALGQQTPQETHIIGLAAYNGVAGFTGPDRVLIRDRFIPYFVPDGMPDHVFRLREVNLNSPSSMKSVGLIEPNITGATLGCALVSPHGDRILWSYLSYNVSTGKTLIERMRHRVYTSTQVVITDLHGTYRADLGTILNESPLSISTLPIWCPDGRAISFVNGGMLYRVDATRAHTK